MNSLNLTEGEILHPPCLDIICKGQSPQPRCAAEFLGLVLGVFHLNLSHCPSLSLRAGQEGISLTNDASLGCCGEQRQISVFCLGLKSWVRSEGTALPVYPCPGGMFQNHSGWPQQTAFTQTWSFRDCLCHQVQDELCSGYLDLGGWMQEPSLCPKLLFPVEN